MWVRVTRSQFTKSGHLVVIINFTNTEPSSPWWSLGGRADGGFVYAMSRKQTSREPVLLDAAEASEDESSPLCSEYRGLSYAPNVAYIRNPPKDFRMGAILSAIFCFFPLGLFAIYYSFRTERLFRSGNLSGSITASDRTRLLINLALLVGSLLWFGGVIGAVLFANRFRWQITFCWVIDQLPGFRAIQFSKHSFRKFYWNVDLNFKI